MTDQKSFHYLLHSTILGLRAPAAWQSRGVFHNIIRLEYYQKRCVSIWILRQLDKEFTIKIAHL